MNNTIDLLLEQQERAEKRLYAIYNWVEHGKEFGLDLRKLKSKVVNTLDSVKSGKIKIVMLGGFSEGKTSVVASWLGHLTNDMQIDVDESSDAIRIYRLEDKLNIEIVDSPGLFGYKSVEDTEGMVKFEEITRTYISESHLILYVMNAVNPLKNSHSEIIKWVMGDLKKLDNTLFVFNKFDDVCDIEDEDDYESLYQIKRKSLLEHLQKILNIDSSIAADLPVVAIAANPYNKGLEFWMEHRDEYDRLSHINCLKEATHQLLESKSGHLFTQQVDSAIADIVTTHLSIFEKVTTKYQQRLLERSESIERLKQQMNLTYHSLSEKSSALLEEINQYLDSLIHEVANLSIDDWEDFYNKEIGKDGVMVNNHLAQILKRYTVEINDLLNSSTEQLVGELSFREGIIEKYVKEWVDRGIFFLEATPARFLEKSINYMKKILSRGTTDLGKKGVQEVSKTATSSSLNLVKGIQNTLVLLSAAMEMYDLYKKQHEKSKFDEVKQMLTSYLNEQRIAYQKAFQNEENFVKFFYPEFDELKTSVIELEGSYNSLKELSKDYQEWLQEGRVLLK